jgi:hypothetical protein
MRQRKIQAQANRTQPGHTLSRTAVRVFAANERMNQMVIEHLDPAAWTAKPPGKTRTIAAILRTRAMCGASGFGLQLRT